MWLSNNLKKLYSEKCHTLAGKKANRNSAIAKINRLLFQALRQKLQKRAANSRITTANLHIIHEVAEWDYLHRNVEMILTTRAMQTRIDDLTSFITGGLLAQQFTPAARVA